MPTPFVSDVATTLTSTPSGQVAMAFSLTLLGGLAIGKLRGVLRAREAARKDASPPSLPRELLLPVVHQDPDHIARAEIIACVTDLILKGDWRGVTEQIAVWECRLEATPAGTRYHDIAIETCLAALQNLIDEAPRDTLSDLTAANMAAEQMVERHRADPANHILAVIAARAHMVVAETCSADFWPESENHAAWRKMAQHYLVAEAILAPFDPKSALSPLLGDCAYRLSLGMPDGGARLRPAFETWISLDPSDPAIYARHVRALLPENYGSATDLLREAEAAERRTSDTLGRGGYALVALPAIDLDETLRDAFDFERLAGGLIDLASHSGTQAEVNWAAAHLARESEFGSSDRRRAMSSAFDALVRRHLGVIYPRLWGMPLEEIRRRLRDIFAPSTASSEPSSLTGTPPDVRAAA